ncbi:MAG: efflux RND transporter periplasmic adaptor subunit [Candidatus Krumholzibacteriia bacterium]
MNSKRARLLRTVAILAVLVIVILFGWVAVRPTPDLVQGEVEATEVRIAAKIPARVEAIAVREGDTVRRGDLLVTLTSPEIAARLEQAEAAHAAASAQRSKADTGAREEEIRAAHNLWLRAEAAADLADTTAGRIQRLYRDGIVSEQRRDEAAANQRASRDAANAARAAYDMARNGARSEDRRAAAALEDQAAGAVSEVHAYLDETRLVAPLAGEVSVVVAEAGEIAAAGYPILTILDLSDTWVSFNLREDRLGRVRLGGRIRARVPALDDQEVTLEVDYIAPQGDYATWRATSAAGGFDLKTFEVRARPVAPVDGLRPGMSVIVDWGKLAADGGPHD